MPNKDLPAIIADTCGCSRKTAKAALTAVFAAIAQGSTLLADGVRLGPELGTLRRVAVKAKEGRNPRTGAKLLIPSGYRIRFSPAAALKRRLGELAPPRFGAKRAA